MRFFSIAANERWRAGGMSAQLDAGRTWWEPYCGPDATDEEKIEALIRACSYWHQVAETNPAREARPEGTP